MIDTRGLDINMESEMVSNAGRLLYNPKSDFIIQLKTNSPFDTSTEVNTHIHYIYPVSLWTE